MTANPARQRALRQALFVVLAAVAAASLLGATPRRGVPADPLRASFDDLRAGAAELAVLAAEARADPTAQRDAGVLAARFAAARDGLGAWQPRAAGAAVAHAQALAYAAQLAALAEAAASAPAATAPSAARALARRIAALEATL